LDPEELTEDPNRFQELIEVQKGEVLRNLSNSPGVHRKELTVDLSRFEELR
jgi:hypothetical protein